MELLNDGFDTDRVMAQWRMEQRARPLEDRIRDQISHLLERIARDITPDPSLAATVEHLTAALRNLEAPSAEASP